MGMGDVEAAIVLEELAGPTFERHLAQLIYNGPSRPSSTSAATR